MESWDTWISCLRDVDEQCLDDNLARLKSTIHSILQNHRLTVGFEALYTTAYWLVLRDRGLKLYEGVRDMAKKHAEKMLETGSIRQCNVAYLEKHFRIRVDVLKARPDKFLITLNRAWKDFTASFVKIADVLGYMDRVFVQRHSMEKVYTMGLTVFREHVLRDGQVRYRLQKILLAREDCGKTESGPSVRNACQMVMEASMGGREEIL